jgi:hypothetical protein
MNGSLSAPLEVRRVRAAKGEGASWKKNINMCFPKVGTRIGTQLGETAWY